MNKKIKYTDESLGELRRIKDFLPSPEQLIFKERTVKVTIALSKSSIDYFKKIARRHRAPYQKMIRRLLDDYVSRQDQRKESLKK